MTKQIIIVGRGRGGTRAIAGTLAQSGVFVGRVNGQHYDHTPPSKMYNAVGMFGKLVTEVTPYRWDFSQAMATEPPDDYRRLVTEYLAEFREEPHEVFSWKLPETILALPWLVKMFPDAYYIHWVRDGRDNCLEFHGTENFKKFFIPHEQRNEKYYNGAVSWHYIESLVEATPKPEHWMTVRFEDFVLRQNETLSRLAEYLQIKLTKIEVFPDRVGRWQREGHDLSGVVGIMDYHLKKHGYIEDTSIVEAEPMAIKDLNKVLKQIGEDFTLDGAALVKFSREDKTPGKDQGNQYGTDYTVDGKLLYALIRELKPVRILEIGTYHGGNVAHMAQACKVNSSGAIVAMNEWEEAGVNLPKSLREYVEVVTEKFDFYLPKITEPFDFIFEDGPHSEHSSHNIYQALPQILKPGGLILSHDTSTGVGQYVRNGMVKGGAKLEEVRFYNIPPSPCGMSVYRFMGY